STGALEERSQDNTLSVTKDGEIFFNREPLRFDELPARLARLKAEQPDPKAFVNGDEKAYFGAAVHVLDELRQSGITRVSIDTRPKD
ncbi:MAG TPA: biopolymer transporter ExbD, partial [Polyangiaceae bacterium]|nr:biopolymer transporter ExbD [Polyangiaceae bacterium]